MGSALICTEGKFQKERREKNGQKKIVEIMDKNSPNLIFKN
jgi:hypothetical protein